MSQVSSPERGHQPQSPPPTYVSYELYQSILFENQRISQEIQQIHMEKQDYIRRLWENKEYIDRLSGDRAKDLAAHKQERQDLQDEVSTLERAQRQLKKEVADLTRRQTQLLRDNENLKSEVEFSNWIWWPSRSSVTI